MISSSGKASKINSDILNTYEILMKKYKANDRAELKFKFINDCEKCIGKFKAKTLEEDFGFLHTEICSIMLSLDQIKKFNEMQSEKLGKHLKSTLMKHIIITLHSWHQPCEEDDKGCMPFLKQSIENPLFKTKIKESLKTCQTDSMKFSLVITRIDKNSIINEINK